MAGISVGDIQAVFRVIDEASGPLNKIAGEVAATESGFEKLGGVIKGAAVAATAAVAAITAVGAAVVKIGEYGAGVGDISEQFDKLAQKAGVDTAQALDALRTATAGTLSDLELMKAALPLLSSGFKGSAEDLGTMAEAARVLSERGMSLDQAMQMVTSAMTTGRTRALAMQGVVIDMQGAMKDLTDATNEEGGAVESSAALHVKQQEILKGLKGLVQENGEVMLDFADRTDQVRVSFANFYNEFARRLSESEALTTVFDRIATAITNAFGGESQQAMDTLLAAFDRVVLFVGDVLVVAIEEGIKVFRWLKEAAEGVAQSGAWRALVTALSAIWDVLTLVWDVVTLVGKALLWLAEKVGVFAAIQTGFEMMATAVEWVSTAVQWAVDKVNLLISAWDTLRGKDPGLPKVTGGFDDLNKRGFQPVIAATDALKGKLGPLTQGIGAAGTAAKVTTDQMKALKAAEDAMSGQKQADEVNALVAAYDRLVTQGKQPTIEASKKLHAEIEKVIAIYLELGQQVPPKLLTLLAATEDAARGIDQWAQETTLAVDAVWTLGQALEDELAPSQEECYANTMKQLEANRASIPVWQQIADAIQEVPELLDAVGEATEGVPPMLKRAAQEGAKSWGEGFTDIAKNFGTLMADAIINGNWKNAFSALGTQVGSFLGQKLGTSLGASIGNLLGDTLKSVLPGIGAMLGPLVGWLGDKLFKTEGRKVNDMRDAYIKAAGGLDVLNKKARDAGMTLNALLRADTVKEFEAAVASLNKELDETAKIQGELTDLQAQLASRQVMDWQKAEDLIKQYGGTLETLGQQFVAAKQAASWKDVWDDWQTLIDMGADVGGVLSAMKDEIQALVQQSLKIGTEIPAQFKPLIEELIRTGQLFDASGEAITDLAQLKFGAPLVSELDKLILKIDDLIKALTERLVPALGQVSRPIDEPWKDWEMPDLPDYGNAEMPSYAMGTRGQFVDFGQGTLAMLHGRERVMTEGEAQGSSGAVGGDVTIPIYLDASTKLTEIVLRRVGNRLAVAGVRGG